MPRAFKEGDIVRLITGKQPLRIVAISGSYLVTRYLSSGSDEHNRPLRRASDFVLHESYIKEAKKMAKLYEIKKDGGVDLHTPLFGTLLAENSAGQLVLEIKGTNEVKVINREDAEEVRPHTVTICFSGRPPQSYRIPKDALAKGDIIVNKQGDVGRVTATDTKQGNAGALRGAVKLASTPIEDTAALEGDDE